MGIKSTMKQNQITPYIHNFGSKETIPRGMDFSYHVKTNMSVRRNII